jgi:hypothetical protein
MSGVKVGVIIALYLRFRALRPSPTGVGGEQRR